MKIFGWTIARTRDLVQKALAPVDNRGGWWPIIREFAPGAWQSNVEVTLEDSLRYWAVFRCISIIASDIGKMRLKLVEMNDDGIWSETASTAFSPVLRKPNPMQNRIQFIENWMTSKLSRGNTYVLKRRDARGVVTGLYILDPNRVTPLVADNGDVFYRLNRDNVTGITVDLPTVPASEIVHDRWNCLYHPLVGLSPLYASGINALAGLKATNSSARFFNNGARPSVVLTAPGAISDATAARAKAYWEENFTGENAGKVAVLGDNLKAEQLTMSMVDAQLIEQLKWNDATIAGAFGVPTHMINAAAAPATNNVEALNQQYYSQCLQIHIEFYRAVARRRARPDRCHGAHAGNRVRSWRPSAHGYCHQDQDGDGRPQGRSKPQRGKALVRSSARARRRCRLPATAELQPRCSQQARQPGRPVRVIQSAAGSAC